MRELERTALVDRSPELLYALVNDIERYPEFVPGCSAAKVLEREAQALVAQLQVRRGPLHTEFTTRNELSPPREIRMRLVSGPMKMLEGHWRFAPVGQNGCRVDLALRFQFSNSLKALVLEPLLEETATAMVRAFVARARATHE